jgi:hypothetical protein
MSRRRSSQKGMADIQQNWWPTCRLSKHDLAKNSKKAELTPGLGKKERKR